MTSRSLRKLPGPMTPDSVDGADDADVDMLYHLFLAIRYDCSPLRILLIQIPIHHSLYRYHAPLDLLSYSYSTSRNVSASLPTT